MAVKLWMADGCQKISGKWDDISPINRGFRVSDFLRHHLNIESSLLKSEDFTHEHALYCLQALGQIELLVLFSVRVQTNYGGDFTVQMDSANNSLSVLKEQIFEQCGDIHRCNGDLLEIYEVKNADGKRWEKMDRIADNAEITGNCDVSVYFVPPVRAMFGGNEQTVAGNSCINLSGFGDFTDGLVSVDYLSCL
jgi:hypothetical protein